MVLLFQAVNIKRTMNNTFFPEKFKKFPVMWEIAAVLLPTI